jgi:heme exporter protein B
VVAAAQGLAVSGHMALMGAMLVLALMVAPWAAGAALKL